MWQQPARQPGDGTISLEREGDNIVIRVVHEGLDQTLVCSLFNASRIWAGLALFLQIPTSTSFDSLSRRIKWQDAKREG